MKQNQNTEVSRASFHLLSNLCTVNLFIVMFQNVANVTSNSLQSGKTCVTSIKGAVLAKHDYASFVVQNMFACYYRCKGDIQCQSFNFYEKTQICELNNRTRIVGHLNFQPRQGAFYMDNPFRVTPGSLSELPAVSCQEIKDSSGGLATSGRFWLDPGESGSNLKTVYCDMENGVIVECTNNPCQNGGTCDYQGKGQYTCRCPQGYSGDHCENDACSSQPCLNEGICNATANGFTCSCSPLLTGVHCEIGIGVGCDNYTTSNDIDRSVHVQKQKSDGKCDDKLLEGWYRFNSTAGTRIPDYCVNKDMCNTRSPGWFNGTHPTPKEGAVNRIVCFHFSLECCAWTSPVMVRNCGSFFTYKLPPTPNCSLRYCVTNSTA